MLEQSDRIRIWVAGILAVVVMGGVVALALASRPEEAGSSPVVQPPANPYGKARPDREIRMPPDCEPDPASPPRIVFDLPGDRLDFGKLKQGIVVEKDVLLRNVGSGVLCIANVDTGCGCVKADLVGPNRIPPNGTASVRVKLDTKDREGNVTKDVRLHVNDRSRKDGIASFHVACEVSLGIVAAVRVADFGTLAKGRPGTAVVRLKSPRDEPAWSVTGVTGTRATYRFEAVEAEPADPVFRVVDVRLTHPGSDVMGPSSDVIKIATSHPERPEVVVSASWMVVTKYFARPPYVPFGFVGADSVPQPFPLVVAAADKERAFEVKGVRIEGQGFEAATPERRATGEWVIPVTPRPERRGAGPYTATLVVSVDDPEYPEVRVELRATVRAPK